MKLTTISRPLVWCLFRCQCALACFTAVHFASISDSQAGVLVYDFVNYSFQNGYTIYGEIVTDGHIGILSSNDVQSDPNPVTGALTSYAATSLSISNSGYVAPLPAYFAQFNNLLADSAGNLWAPNASGIGIIDYNQDYSISYAGLGASSYDHAFSN